MISVVICSVNAAEFANVKTSIENTIGVEHELIKIDNAAAKLSLCAAYNKGASQARFEYLCFVHEDVKFITPNWGTAVINHFETIKNAGLLGIAGSVYKTKMCSGWWQLESGWDECRRMNILQQYKNGRPEVAAVVNPLNEIRSQVAVVDGVFMCTKRNIWEYNKFDEKLLTGFHGYDLDFSLHIGQSKKVYVVYDILLNHFSGGTTNIGWMEAILKVHKKWAKQLPVEIVKCDAGDVYENGWKRLRKNMEFYLHAQQGYLKLLNKYNQLCSLLDEKPGCFSFLRDYFVEMNKTIRFYSFKKKDK